LSSEESETPTTTRAERNTTPSTIEEGSITLEIDSTYAPANDDINNSDDDNNNDTNAATNSPPIADEEDDDATMD
jgi:hypothetical protein